MSANSLKKMGGGFTRYRGIRFLFLLALMGTIFGSRLWAQTETYAPAPNQAFPSPGATLSRSLDPPKSPSLRPEGSLSTFGSETLRTAQVETAEPLPDGIAPIPDASSLSNDLAHPLPTGTPAAPLANPTAPSAEPVFSLPASSVEPSAVPAPGLPLSPDAAAAPGTPPANAPGAMPNNAPQPNGPHRGPVGPGGPGRGPQPVQVVVVPQQSDESAQAEKEQAELSPEEKEAQALLTSQLRTPRLAIDFLNTAAMHNDHEKAANAIDFTDRPGISVKEKKEYAFKLYAIINRIAELDLKSIPADDQLTEYEYRPNPQYAGLKLIKKGDRFLFSPETVEEIDDLYEQLRDIRPATFAKVPFLNNLPDEWFKYRFGLRQIQWVFLAVVAVLGYLVGLIVSKVLYYLTITSFHLMSTDLSECKISKKTWRPIGWLIMYTLWYLGILAAHVPPRLVELMGCPIQTLAIFMFIVTALRLVDITTVWGRKKIGKTKSKVDEILIPLLGRTGKIAIIVVGVIMIFQAFGFSAVGIISGMGIGGIAIALAAQNTIANFFGSITVLMDRPFVIGDWIVTSSIEGEVEAVGLRSTRIRTFYNSLVTIPNNLLTTAIIDNMGRRHFRRYKTLLGVQYDTPPDRIEAFCEGIRELILSYNFTRKDIFHVYANEFSASSIDILLVCFFLVPDTAAEYKSRSTLILDIMRLAESMDIRFAFPTQTIYNIRAEDRLYDEPLTSNAEFGRENAAAIIERRTALEKSSKKAGLFGESGFDASKASSLDALTDSISKKSEELLKKKRPFFRRAG